MFQAGLVQAIDMNMIYRLVVEAYEGTGKSQDFMKTMISVVLITQNICAAIYSQIAKRYSPSQIRMAMKFTSVAFTVLLCLKVIIGKIPNIWYVVGPVVLLATFDVSFGMLTSVYLSENFPGRPEPFSMFKQIQNLLSALIILVYVIISEEQFMKINACINVGLAIIFNLVF